MTKEQVLANSPLQQKYLQLQSNDESGTPHWDDFTNEEWDTLCTTCKHSFQNHGHEAITCEGGDYEEDSFECNCTGFTEDSLYLMVSEIRESK